MKRLVFFPLTIAILLAVSIGCQPQEGEGDLNGSSTTAESSSAASDKAAKSATMTDTNKKDEMSSHSETARNEETKKVDEHGHPVDGSVARSEPTRPDDTAVKGTTKPESDTRASKSDEKKKATPSSPGQPQVNPDGSIGPANPATSGQPVRTTGGHDGAEGSGG